MQQIAQLLAQLRFAVIVRRSGAVGPGMPCRSGRDRLSPALAAAEPSAGLGDGVYPFRFEPCHARMVWGPGHRAWRSAARTSL